MTVALVDRTGHELRVADDQSVEFWLGLGYRRVSVEAPAKKAAAKKTTGRSKK